MCRERRSFATNAFHQVAIGTHCVDIEIENLESGPVESRGLPLARDGHSYAVSDALTQRTRGGLDSGSDVRLRMPRCPASELAEGLDVVERYRQIFREISMLIDAPHLGEIQHRVEQHRGMSIRQNEPVAIQPRRIRGIVAKEVLPKLI